ncbi:MAG: AI-2E family transporter [Planctomycetes bacterium]|nr:AI-2E family transporter [Planctomycetota bacterium]
MSAKSPALPPLEPEAEVAEPRVRVELLIPVRTIAMVLAGIVAAWAIVRCIPMMMMLYLAILLAVTLYPAVEWLGKRLRFPQWLGVLVVTLGVVGALAFAVLAVVPPLINQAGDLIGRLPEFRDQALARFPADSAFATSIRPLLESTPDVSGWVKSAGSWLMGTIAGVTSLILVISLSTYLLLDGHGVVRWLVAYLPKRSRFKVHRTMVEIAPVVTAYVAGQVITSLLCSLFTYAVLRWLDVPAALVLAVLAGLLDVLPVLGFIVSLVPAMLIALTVSESTCAMVVAAYCAYNILENYLIVPWVYGNRLKLSTLTVLLALLIGGALFGIFGMVAALPIVAAYPIVERIWFADRLAPEVIEKHAEETAPAS